MSTARNIKDRKNRSNVERALKLVLEELKKYNEAKNGIFIFCGISTEGEVSYSFEPPYESRLSYYRCDNKFHTWMVTDYLKSDQKSILIVLIYGTSYYIYSYTAEINLIQKLYEHSALLVKRQRKGGQSSVRFSRLAEESRLHYVTDVYDKISVLNDEKKIPLIIDGSRELAQDLFVKIPTACLTSNFTVYEDGILRRNIKVLSDLVTKIYDTTEEKIQKIVEDFKRYPDLFLIGEQEIKQSYLDKRMEVLVSLNDVNEYKEVPLIKVPLSSPYYGFIKSIGGLIGKLYY